MAENTSEREDYIMDGLVVPVAENALGRKPKVWSCLFLRVETDLIDFNSRR